MPLQLVGAGSSLVTINIPAAGGYGFHVAADNVALSGFTLAANVANQPLPIHASGSNNPPGGNTCQARDLEVSGAHRTGLDIHGYNNVTWPHHVARRDGRQRRAADRRGRRQLTTSRR
ncbi:MAG: hypothetical protein IPP62_07385 [bacterium]|nr:hypothetical protein [bacterium]